jgi:hypothetical protein
MALPFRICGFCASDRNNTGGEREKMREREEVEREKRKAHGVMMKTTPP